MGQILKPWKRAFQTCGGHAPKRVTEGQSWADPGCWPIWGAISSDFALILQVLFIMAVSSGPPPHSLQYGGIFRKMKTGHGAWTRQWGCAGAGGSGVGGGAASGHTLIASPYPLVQCLLAYLLPSARLCSTPFSGCQAPSPPPLIRA